MNCHGHERGRKKERERLSCNCFIIRMVRLHKSTTQSFKGIIYSEQCIFFSQEWLQVTGLRNSFPIGKDLQNERKRVPFNEVKKAK